MRSLLSMSMGVAWYNNYLWELCIRNTDLTKVMSLLKLPELVLKIRQ